MDLPGRRPGRLSATEWPPRRSLATGAAHATPSFSLEEPAGRLRDVVARALKIALLLFALALAGIAATAWLSGDPNTLPFQYEGFD